MNLAYGLPGYRVLVWSTRGILGRGAFSPAATKGDPGNPVTRAVPGRGSLLGVGSHGSKRRGFSLVTTYSLGGYVDVRRGPCGSSPGKIYCGRKGRDLSLVSGRLLRLIARAAGKSGGRSGEFVDQRAERSIVGAIAAPLSFQPGSRGWPCIPFSPENPSQRFAHRCG